MRKTEKILIEMLNECIPKLDFSEESRKMEQFMLYLQSYCPRGLTELVNEMPRVELTISVHKTARNVIWNFPQLQKLPIYKKVCKYSIFPNDFLSRSVSTMENWRLI